MRGTYKQTKDGPSKTIITNVTEGILFEEILRDHLLTSYDYIILDEIHERTTNIDVILSYLLAVSATLYSISSTADGSYYGPMNVHPYESFL